jgi:hypothetical protein
MMVTRAELGIAVSKDPEFVIAECRRLRSLDGSPSHGSGAVRARLAQLVEYAELLAEQGARSASEPPAYASRLAGME